MNRYQQYRERKRAKVNALKTGPCADCGGTFPPECMDFDHVRGEKLFGIAQGRRLSQTRVLEEVKKCDLVCANCHRIRTRQRILERYKCESA